jgi:hypothetical protein
MSEIGGQRSEIGGPGFALMSYAPAGRDQDEGSRIKDQGKRKQEIE